MAKVSARAHNARARTSRRSAAKAGARAVPALDEVSPELATLVEEPPHDDAKWVYETKYDGYRILARVQNGQVRLATRNGNDFTARAPSVVAALAALTEDGLLLDGELVSPARVGQPRGAGDFQALQGALRDGRSHTLVYYVFDCLFRGGDDLRALPLLARKEALAELVPRDGAYLKRSKHLTGSAATILAHACELGMEGIIAKRSDAPYRGGRGKSWLKLKCTGREEFVVVGFTPPGGARSYLGALLLATREQPKGPLRYAGKVGTGFSVASLRELSQRLKPLRRATPVVQNPPLGAEAKNAQWVEPQLVAEVSFTELTSDGRLRHPSFQGLREDKSAASVVREQKTNGSRHVRHQRARE